MGSNDEKGNNIHGDTYYINQSYKYESDDRQILVDLLREYSEKLVDTCDRLTPARKAISVTNHTALQMSIAIPFAMLISIISLMRSIGYLSIDIPVIFLAIVISIVIGYSSVMYEQQKPPSQKIKLLTEREAKNIALKLEKLIKITTEIQDQIELNLARKIELDLRIADAESALDYYYSTIERKDRKK